MRVDGTTVLSAAWWQRDVARALQDDIAQRQKELSTGRKADVGLALGTKVGRNVSWRMDVARMEAQTTANQLAAQEADLTQSTLESLRTVASGLVDTLMASRNAQNGHALSRQAATGALQDIAALLNTTYDGKYIFAGQNNATPPLAGYAGSAGEAAFDAAFLASFGTTNAAPALTSATPAAVQGFLTGGFSQLFVSPGWEANWSTASSNDVVSQLGDGATANLAANANDPAIRAIIKGVVAVLEVGTGQLNAGAFEKVADFAATSISSGLDQLTATQSRIGFGQQALNRSTQNLSRRLDIIKGQITQTEGVDATEVSVRLNQMMTQLEMSYAVTAKVSRLSLLNYL